MFRASTPKNIYFISTIYNTLLLDYYGYLIFLELLTMKDHVLVATHLPRELTERLNKLCEARSGTPRSVLVRESIKLLLERESCVSLRRRTSARRDVPRLRLTPEETALSSNS